ncbi:MAG: CRISPR-associated endonuclease Cas2 [Anaerolineaceae bacterium]|jgi:CRISPR-associated protein Cas2
MMILITYDVNTQSAAGRKRLNKVAKACKGYGQRVQDSVFECVIDYTQIALLKNKLEKLIDPNLDSIRYYYLGDNWPKRVEHIGVKKGINLEETIIV